jgi:hypothetical protein
MEFLLVRIVGLLRREITVFQNLLKTFQRQQELIPQGDPLALFELQLDQERYLREINLIERDRLEECELLAVQLNIKKTPKLMDLIHKIDERFAKTLLKLRNMLLSLIEKVNEYNQKNRELMQDLLKFNRKELEILTGMGEEAAFYVNTGVKGKALDQRKFVDTMV